MKKLILCGSALLLSLAFANGQGWSTTGGWDDFESATPIVNGPNSEGMYWFELTGGDTLALTRPGTGAMNVTATTAGGCNAGTTTQYGKCYPVFGVNFGNNGAPTPVPYTMNLTTGANIIIDIENTVNVPVFFAIQLEDINGVLAKFEPNVSDLTPSSGWGDPERKSLNGISFDQNERKTVTIDLSSVAGAVGGLSQNGAYNCAPGPYNCPPTNYQIDVTKIKTVLFQVNFGKDDIFISEGKTAANPTESYTDDTFIAAADISAYTGVLKIYDFKIGNYVATGVSAASEIDRSLKVYPNPASGTLNVSFEAANGADVTISDIVGNTVYSATAGAGSNQITVNTSNLPSGVYILNVSTENGRVARKVTIK